MASILKVDTLTGVTTAGSISVTGEGNSTTTNLQQGLCKAWAHFDGVSSTVVIDDSLNISGATDNGTGNYTMNFSNSMGNINYTTTSIDTRISATGGNRSIQGTFAVGTGKYSISNVYDASVFDNTILMMQIIGDLA